LSYWPVWKNRWLALKPPSPPHISTFGKTISCTSLKGAMQVCKCESWGFHFVSHSFCDHFSVNERLQWTKVFCLLVQEVMIIILWPQGGEAVLQDAIIADKAWSQFFKHVHIRQGIMSSIGSGQKVWSKRLLTAWLKVRVQLFKSMECITKPHTSRLDTLQGCHMLSRLLLGASLQNSCHCEQAVYMASSASTNQKTLIHLLRDCQLKLVAHCIQGLYSWQKVCVLRRTLQICHV